jgi:hypothetical protein
MVNQKRSTQGVGAMNFIKEMEKSGGGVTPQAAPIDDPAVQPKETPNNFFTEALKRNASGSPLWLQSRSVRW